MVLSRRQWLATLGTTLAGARALPGFGNAVLLAASPGPRAGHVFVYEPDQHACCLLGGYQGKAPRDEVIWRWNGSSWKMHGADAGSSPLARALGAAVYDEKRHRLTYYGGLVIALRQAERRGVDARRQQVGHQPRRQSRPVRSPRRGVRQPARAQGGVRRAERRPQLDGQHVGVRRQEMARHPDGAERAGTGRPRASRDGLRRRARTHRALRRHRRRRAAPRRHVGVGRDALDAPRRVGSVGARRATGWCSTPRAAYRCSSAATPANPSAGQWILSDETWTWNGAARQKLQRRRRPPRRAWRTRSRTTRAAGARCCSSAAPRHRQRWKSSGECGRDYVEGDGFIGSIGP